MDPKERRALVYGLAVTGAFAAIDIALSNNAPISDSFMLGAIVAGVLGGFRPAAVVGLIALGLTAASGTWNHDYSSGGYAARAFVALAGSLLALGAGRLHEQNEDQFARQELLGAVAELPHPHETLEQTLGRVVDLLVPRYARFAALASELGGHELRLVSRGAEPADGRAVTEARLVARGRDIGSLRLSGGRAGSGDSEFLRILGGRVALALDNAGLSQELVTVEQRLQAILENLAEAVTVQDRSGRLVFANRAAARLLHADSVDELLEMPPEAIMARFTAVREDGRPVERADLPARAVLEGREVSPLLVRARHNASGEERWRLTKSTPVRGPGGEVVLAVNVIEDVTETRRAELSQRLLSDASAALASSLDYASTLQRVAELVVPSLADRCSVVIPSGPELEQVALAPAGAAMPGLAEAQAEVLRTGAALMLPESFMVAPMATPERTVGVLALVSAESQRRFSEADLDLALELGRRAATAVESARLYSQLEHVATTLQRSLLPPALPEVPGWKFASLYLPAGDETDVGGDFYDVFPTAAGWMAVMGDVVGRGPAAASLTAMGRYTLRTAGSLVGTPTMGLARLNENLRERGDMALCTAAVVLLREGTNEASLVCAGHPLPFQIRGGKAEQVGRTGPMLGAFDGGHWLPFPLELEPGDVLVLYTDGVIDARGASERFGEERLGQTLTGASSAEDAVERIRAALLEFAGGEQDDDTAVLALQKL